MECCQLSRFFFYRRGMKQLDHSDAPARPSVETAASRERIRKNFLLRFLHGKAMRVLLLLLTVALCIVIYVLANKPDPAKSEAGRFSPPVDGASLQVEVLDGAGNMKAAQRVTNFLRARGYDVVEMKKNSEGIEERSIIIDRSGNLEAAKKMASSMGIPPDKVFQKVDRTLYLDITFVLGKDYSRLTAFQSLPERTKH